MITAYLSWHYGQALRSVLRIAANGVAFALHLFSIKELLASLFSPWRRISEESSNKGLSQVLAVLWDNLVSRILGAIARLVLLTAGILFLMLMTTASALLVLLWVLGPLLPVMLISLGVFLIIPSSPMS